EWSDDPQFAEKKDQVGVTGICGSGIIEAVAELYLAGVITVDGLIDGALAERSPRVVQKGRTFAYVVASEGIELTITQTDIR
ncbi:ASKHA domain-containing protein, partial [Klebsiella pneumoniae]